MSGQAQMTDAELTRFWSKVDKTDGCWNWTAVTDGRYGTFAMGNRRPKAHRVLWEHINGPITAGLELDHLCRNTLCVNPAHLEAVSHRENTLRGDGPSARHARKTHCKYGHLLDGDNLHVDPRSGMRQCRTCKRRRDAQYRKAKAAT